MSSWLLALGNCYLHVRMKKNCPLCVKIKLQLLCEKQKFCDMRNLRHDFNEHFVIFWKFEVDAKGTLVFGKCGCIIYLIIYFEKKNN